MTKNKQQSLFDKFTFISLTLFSQVFIPHHVNTRRCELESHWVRGLWLKQDRKQEKIWELKKEKELGSS